MNNAKIFNIIGNYATEKQNYITVTVKFIMKISINSSDLSNSASYLNSDKLLQ